MKNNEQWKALHFDVKAPLERCADSMLFNSGTVIAELTALHVPNNIGVCVKLRVVGDVAVAYKGQVYHAFSNYPAELKRRMEMHPNGWMRIEGKPDIQVGLNNWFEYACCISDNSGSHMDSILCEDDLHLLTDDELKTEMLEVALNAIEAEKQKKSEVIAKIRDCEITRQNIEKAEKMLVAYGVSEDKVATALQSIGYTLLDVELFPEVC